MKKPRIEPETIREEADNITSTFQADDLFYFDDFAHDLHNDSYEQGDVVPIADFMGNEAAISEIIAKEEKKTPEPPIHKEKISIVRSAG